METNEQLAKNYLDLGWKAIQIKDLAHMAELKSRTMDLERGIRTNERAGKPVLNLFVRLMRVEETLEKIQNWWEMEYGELAEDE